GHVDGRPHQFLHGVGQPATRHQRRSLTVARRTSGRAGAVEGAHGATGRAAGPGLRRHRRGDDRPRPGAGDVRLPALGPPRTAGGNCGPRAPRTQLGDLTRCGGWADGTCGQPGSFGTRFGSGARSRTWSPTGCGTDNGAGTRTGSSAGNPRCRSRPRPRSSGRSRLGGEPTARNGNRHDVTSNGGTTRKDGRLLPPVRLSRPLARGRRPALAPTEVRLIDGCVPNFLTWIYR